jgi:aryl-alcohol dehydrogenase-like predicted oxidoreductase
VTPVTAKPIPAAHFVGLIGSAREADVISRAPFGRTGHESSRTLFGAAALGAMKQSSADRVLDSLLEHGVNHIDTAASYGESELRLAPWLARHRDEDFFLATKTGERTYDGARQQLHRSLERLGTDSVDLIQMHNLVEPDEWKTAMGPGGALEALVEARAQGLVRFIGVTGHGTRVAEMHARSLERFPFDSVLLPYNFTMMSGAEYAADFEALVATCAERGVAVQTIKAIARRRWQDDSQPHYSWYEPIRDPEALRRSVHWVLRRPGLFLNTSSDATLLPLVLSAAAEFAAAPADDEIAGDIGRLGIEPLFVRGESDRI